MPRAVPWTCRSLLRTDAARVKTGKIDSLLPPVYTPLAYPSWRSTPPPELTGCTASERFAPSVARRRGLQSRIVFHSVERTKPVS